MAFGTLFLMYIRYAVLLLSIGVFSLVLSKNRYIASVVMAGVLPVVLFYFNSSPLSALLGTFTGFLIIVKHRQNF